MWHSAIIAMWLSSFLSEGVRQPGEAPRVHPHVEVLTFHIAGADVVVIGSADDIHALGAKTLRRALAFLSLGVVAVHLHQLRVVHSRRERIGDGYQIHLVSIRSQLDTVCQPALNILKKLRRTPGVPPSNHRRNHELGLRFDCGERPNVSAGPGFHLGSLTFFALHPTNDQISST